MNIWSLIGIVGSALISAWAFMRFIITKNFRLDDNLSKSLLKKMELCNFKFEINNEFSINKKYPTV